MFDIRSSLCTSAVMQAD